MMIIGSIGYIIYIKNVSILTEKQKNNADRFPILGSMVTLKGTASQTAGRNRNIYIFQVFPNASGDNLFVYRKPGCKITKTYPTGETNCDVGTRFISIINGKANLASILTENIKQVEISGKLQEDKDGTITDTGGFQVYIIVDSIKEL